MSTRFCKFAFLFFGAVCKGGLFIFWGIYTPNPRACRRRISPRPRHRLPVMPGGLIYPYYKKSWVNYAFTLDK